MKKIKVIIADDYGILRYGLRSYLSRTRDIEIVGEASAGQECIQLFEDTLPDVCVIDIEMPKKNGLEVVDAIRKRDKNAKVLIFSMHNDKSTIRKAFEAGINGYLLKNTSMKKIAEAIRTIDRGKKVWNDMAPEPKPHAINRPLENRITKREKEILKLVVEGYSSPEIAQKLYISDRTVETHRNNIMQKLDTHNTASLVRFALQNNLVNGSGVV
jgi:DNA-binding NarL/FixJ family response regulator